MKAPETYDSYSAFRTRVADWADRLQIDGAGNISVEPLPKKWASCSLAGHLTFDESLPVLPGALQDYVIVHELLHLVVPNHGKLWRMLMRAHLGDFEETEKQLKLIASGKDFG